MITVLRHTPPWLPEHTFGKGLFTVEPTANRQPPRKSGPLRTVARRGDEIFVAVGNQLRWANWKILDHQWRRERELRKQQQARQKETKKKEGKVFKGAEPAPYRVLKVPVWEEIRQLVISPFGDLIAILTSHTVHVAVLPDPSHLRGPESEPVRVRAFTVGSTTHVLARPALASAVWHPLGVAGHCLVTTTTDAIVRIWEFDLENRWSFDSPRLTINLKRLADGLPQDQDQDLASSRMSANKVFSPDSVEMEVAMTCFGGSASPIRHPWAAMTLWIAMREGDVYALCPLLPSKWSCTPALISSLSACIASDVALARVDTSLSASQHRILDERLSWITQVERQRYTPDSPHSNHASDPVFYRRPDELGPIPDLQGPFQLDLLPDEDDDENKSSLLTDIHIIPPTFHLLARGRFGVKSDSEDVEGLSWGIVCLLRDSGRLHVLLDVEGVQGQWASQEESADGDDSLELDDAPSLLHFLSMDLASPGSDPTWPLFTPAPHSANSVFVTHGHGVTHLSLSYLVEALEKEIRAGGGSGADLRLDVIASAQGMTIAQTIFEHEHSHDSTALTQDLPACVVFPPSESECMLMTARPGASIAVAYAEMRGDGGPTAAVADDAGAEDHESNNKSLVRRGQRPAYVPAPGFSVHLPLLVFIEQQIRGRNKGYFSKDIRFSQPTLSIMTDAHTMLSQYTHMLGDAAAELFRQCERMLEEFRDQIENVKEVGYRVDHVVDEDGPKGDGGGGDGNHRPKVSRDKGIQRRIDRVKSKNQELTRRVAALRRKGNALGEPIRSAKEEAWMMEIEQLQSTILDGRAQGDDNDPNRASIRTRYFELQRLASEILPEVEAISKRRPTSAAVSTEVRVPAAIREKKAQQVLQMLERESALLEATKSRLQQLSLVPS